MIKKNKKRSRLYSYTLRVITSSFLMYNSTTTPGQSGRECNGNEGLLHTHLSSRTRASPADGLVSLVRRGFTPLQRCNQHILQPHPTGQRKDGANTTSI